MTVRFPYPKKMDRELRFYSDAFQTQAKFLDWVDPVGFLSRAERYEAQDIAYEIRDLVKKQIDFLEDDWELGKLASINPDIPVYENMAYELQRRLMFVNPENKDVRNPIRIDHNIKELIREINKIKNWPKKVMSGHLYILREFGKLCSIEDLEWISHDSISRVKELLKNL